MLARARTVILIVLTLAAYYTVNGHEGIGLGPRANPDLTRFLGTWTDGKGEPGNSVRFFQLERKLPNGGDFIVCYEGGVMFHHCMGCDGRASWNYESITPLRLNITFGETNRIAALEFVDDDHLLIRFVEYLPDSGQWQVVEGPDVHKLTRVRAGD
jgi:hypothetical protein